MPGDRFRIGVVAPAGPVRRDVPERVHALVASLYPERTPEVHFHPQCFLSAGHFAGSDGARAAAFLEIANDDAFDAVWFGRGGYGSCRMVEAAMPLLGDAARAKAYLGYSDTGVLLGALYGAGFGRVAHGPMAQDVLREGGEGAVTRSLRWLIDGDRKGLEPSVSAATPSVAFNIAVLSQIVGTPLQPDLTGHVLMLEEVSEYMYRIDRYLFHVTSNPAIRQVAGIRLGRFSDVPGNDPDFVLTAEQVIRFWCERSGIPYLGRADIGHDAANKIVPFGRLAP